MQPGMSMTEAQKTEALRLLGEGRIYKEIGEQIGATTESVKQFFYRNRKHKQPIRCEQCHQTMIRNESRQQRFCSYSCRMRWWSHHPEAFSNSEDHHYCCKTCGKYFYSRRAASFCSRPCYYESRRKEVNDHGLS